MKKLTLFAVLVAAVLVCLSVAIVVSTDRKNHQTVTQALTVKSLQAQLKVAQDLRQQHDATNTTALHNAGAEIVSLTNQKVALCTQLKSMRLTNPVCQ